MGFTGVIGARIKWSYGTRTYNLCLGPPCINELPSQRQEMVPQEAKKPERDIQTSSRDQPRYVSDLEELQDPVEKCMKMYSQAFQAKRVPLTDH